MLDNQNGSFSETSYLRNEPYIEAHAVLLAYDDALAQSKTTTALPIGTQARFIAAAALAAAAGTPLNTMLTIAWDRLFASRDVNELRTMTVTTRIDHLIERLRKWLRHRRILAFYIWVREDIRNEGEHLHIAFHLPPKLRDDLAQQAVAWTNEPAWHGRHRAATEGEFACGECRSWHLARGTGPTPQGRYLAAYLGKGEPSQRLFRGQMRDNQKKPIRGVAYGGRWPNGKYDIDQGSIMGTKDRRDRYFISKALQSLEKEHKKSQIGKP